MIRPMVMDDWQPIVEMFKDWPLDNKGPCTEERTLGNMRRWLQQFRPYVWVEGGQVVGFINCDYDYTEVVHAAVLPAYRGRGVFTLMSRALADLVIEMGVDQMSFVAMDQARFIADKYHYTGSAEGETGLIHLATVNKEDFSV